MGSSEAAKAPDPRGPPAMTRLWEGRWAELREESQDWEWEVQPRDTAGCGGERPFQGARALGCLTRKTRKGWPCVRGQSGMRMQEQVTSSGSPPRDWGLGLGRRPQTPGLRALRLPLRPSPPRGGHRGATEPRGPAGPDRVPGPRPAPTCPRCVGPSPPKPPPRLGPEGPGRTQTPDGHCSVGAPRGQATG